MVRVSFLTFSLNIMRYRCDPQFAVLRRRDRIASFFRRAKCIMGLFKLFLLLFCCGEFDFMILFDCFDQILVCSLSGGFAFLEAIFFVSLRHNLGYIFTKDE